MKCRRHNKDITAVCTWCGAEMCRLCISKTDGKKAYCSSCAAQIGDLLQKKQMETIKKEEEIEKKKIPNDYFNFNTLKRP